MGIELEKKVITYRNLRSNCFILRPVAEVKAVGIFAHGYTSHKGDLLSWATRLCEEGLLCVVFDLPGHYLGGSLCEPTFEEFCNDAHYLFKAAFDATEHSGDGATHLILGGHSLGALLSFKAMTLPEFSKFNKISIGVGFGMAPINGDHIFKSAFYKSTLNIRTQLVTGGLHPDNIFPWVKTEKENLEVSGERIHLIVGEDDLVVGSDGAERLQALLENNGNKVTLDKPTKLPHHMPEQAASFVKKFLKSENII